MAEARRRVLDQYGIELEREVELLGDVVLPPAGDLP
jgi:UDP-N-acetylenolpyruvoylglucosamine reductase